MNEPKKGIETARRSAFEGGAEHVANPGNPDCGILAGRYNFAYYMGVEEFGDLPKETQKIFYEEWNKGIAAERKACGLR